MKYRKVFCLGDSRTGTSSLSNFLISAGYNSIHYYLDRVGFLEENDDNYSENCSRLKYFIDNSGFDAFCDFPTRTYYSFLGKEYGAESAFVLTYRSSLEVWRRSMIGYMALMNVEIDIDLLSEEYLINNFNIRRFFNLKENFLQLCVDSENSIASSKLCSFLGIRGGIEFKQMNTVRDHLNYISSKA